MKLIGSPARLVGSSRAPNAPIAEPRQDSNARFDRLAVTAYLLLHLGCLGVFYTGIDAQDVVIFCGAFMIRAIAVSVVYHRYFAHRAFRTSRALQFVLGLYGTIAVLGGPIWWAQTHREHHRHADTPYDIHSPHYQGFLYAHCGWFLDNEHREVDLSRIRDLARFPEIVWLQRWSTLFKLFYIAGAYWWLGTVGIVWGFLLPTVVVLQMIHWIQSVSHSIGGYRRYPTPDDSRNHWLFGVLSLGEGFHHNHHCFPGSARLGLRWWEVDFGYYLLVGLSRLGLVWDVRVPTAQQQYGRDTKRRSSARRCMLQHSRPPR
jgi:stearoyl-CoA desaturase (delta-9 desaturase)